MKNSKNKLAKEETEFSVLNKMDSFRQLLSAFEISMREETIGVSAEYLEREKRYVKAEEEGDENKADEIASEGL